MKSAAILDFKGIAISYWNPLFGPEYAYLKYSFYALKFLL